MPKNETADPSTLTLLTASIRKRAPTKSVKKEDVDERVVCEGTKMNIRAAGKIGRKPHYTELYAQPDCLDERQLHLPPHTSVSVSLQRTQSPKLAELLSKYRFSCPHLACLGHQLRLLASALSFNVAVAEHYRHLIKFPDQPLQSLL